MESVRYYDGKNEFHYYLYVWDIDGRKYVDWNGRKREVRRVKSMRFDGYEII